MVSVEGAVAVVTGGQRGIGKAIVDELLSRGAAKVYATARSPKPNEDPRVVSVALDVTHPDSITALAAAATDAEIVVNNAAVLEGASLLQDDFARIRSVFETNYFGALLVTRAFAPVLAANGGGALVDIASVASWLSGSGAYGDSKAALWSATNSLRLELAPQNTLVVGAHLAYTDTEMVADVDEPKNDPRDVAAAVLDAVERDEVEVLADDRTREVRAGLPDPIANPLRPAPIGALKG